MEDMALLREYAASNSEEAFRTLVDRHLDMVYATALRQVSDRELAEEVTQSVFVALARKAGSISKATILAGWLFRAARFAAAKATRSESRRRHWEREAAQMENEPSSSEPVWEQIAPLVNDALAQLSEVDRCAVILRFFESKSFQQIGSALGTTEVAAKMRLSRAMEKLREIFQKRGVVVPAGALLAALSTQAAQAAPAGLASSIVASALLKTATTSMLTKGILVMATAKQKIGIAAAVTVLALAGGGTTGFIGYRLGARAHTGEVARGDARPPDSRPPAVADQEPVTVAFSDNELDDQKKRAEAGGRQAGRRFVVREMDGDPGNGDVMVLNAGGGTNTELRMAPGGGGTVVMRKRGGKRLQGSAGAPTGVSVEAGAEGPGGIGYGGSAPAPGAPPPAR